ncbi:ribonuclease H-like domain-containing protein [Tanacetum coccineum]
MSRNQDNSRRTINVEEISSKAILAIDGAGFDWSFMVDEEVSTDMGLMAFSDSEFNKSEFNLAIYKRGLTSVEEQLVFYKKNEVLFCEQLAVLKRDISYKDSEISVLKNELEKLKQEKESNQLKIEKFNNASKSIDKLIWSQIPDKSRKGLGFPEFEGYGPKTSKSVSEDTSNDVRKSLDASLIEELVSNDQLEKKTIFHTVAKINFVRSQQQEKLVRKPVKYAEETCPVSQTSRNLMEDMLHLGEEPKEEELLMCDKKNSVFFTDTGCFVLSSNFKLADESQVLLKIPRKNNMYSVDMKNIVPKECLTCLVAKVTLDESMLWHRRLENLVDKKVKIIRCDNGIEFKNRVMSEFCEKKGIKREFSVARIPQQNGVAERRNRTLIEAARTMILVVKPHNKTPYELFRGTTSNDFVGTKESIGAGHSSKEPGSSQYYILMPLWKDGSLFDSSSKNVSNEEPQPFNDVEKIDYEVPTAPLESTYADFFSDESKLDLSNIATTYPVPTTLNTRIHKDHSLDHVLGDVQSGVQTRRMINEQGFISAVYEGKTHEDLHTCLFACFLSQEESKKTIQALKDPSWIEAMQEELLQFKLQLGGFTLW